MKLNSRRLVAIYLIILLLVIVTGVILSSRDSNVSQYDTSTPKEPEKGGPDTVYIDGTDKISKFLLPRQLEVTKQALSDYIKLNIEPNAEKAAISGEPKHSSDGLLTFSVQVDKTASSFEVVIDKYSSYKELSFSVPETDYNILLPVYSN